MVEPSYINPGRMYRLYMSVQLLELAPLNDSQVPKQFHTELLTDELVCSSQPLSLS